MLTPSNGVPVGLVERAPDTSSMTITRPAMWGPSGSFLQLPRERGASRSNTALWMRAFGRDEGKEKGICWLLCGAIRVT